MRLLVGNVPRTTYIWKNDAKHRAQCKRLNIFERVWPENQGPFPWRLTKPQRLLLDGRLKQTLWPHHMEPLYYRGASFWQAPGRMWKARRKFRLLFFILCTNLRDQVPAFRNALLLFCWAMRRLLGQSYCYEAAVEMGILPGSRAVFKCLIKHFHRDLVRALALFEGCTPVDHAKPAWHRFEHAAEFTSTHGNLENMWMMCFERYNKYLKNHVRQYQHPDINLAHTTSQTDTANFFDLDSEENYDLPAELYHRCVLSMRCSQTSTLTSLEVADLRILGVRVEDHLAVTEYKIAHILGKHFRSGEWGNYRCGSVVTVVLDGRSLYARVEKFFRVDEDKCCGYASVIWFGVPEYPFDIPLVVKCREEEPQELVDAYGCVLRITQIDPSPVMVERQPDRVHCWMMRDSGYDTLDH